MQRLVSQWDATSLQMQGELEVLVSSSASLLGRTTSRADMNTLAGAIERRRRNARCSPFIDTLTVDSEQAVLRHCSHLMLWRMRAVSRHFRTVCSALLLSMPMPWAIVGKFDTAISRYRNSGARKAQSGYYVRTAHAHASVSFNRNRS